MQATQFRHYHALLRPSLILLACLGFLTPVRAQLNIQERDQRYMLRPFHFGIEIGVNTQDYKITLDSQYVAQSTILKVASKTVPGFTFGIVSDLHMSPRFDLRFVPDLSFQDRSIVYSLRNVDSTPVKSVSSLYMDFPILLKYKSKPYKDMRLYVLAGLKFSHDFYAASNIRNAKTLIKTQSDDISFDYGLGFEFHLPLVIISPEIKVSYGLDNVLKQDNSLIYSSVLQKLRTRCILICMKFEG